MTQLCPSAGVVACWIPGLLLVVLTFSGPLRLSQPNRYARRLSGRNEPI